VSPSARATQSPSLQELFERGVVIRSSRARSRPCREMSPCPRVPASPKTYPSRTREEIEISPLQATQRAHVQGFQCKPSDGLEPSTPSLPWASLGNWSQPTATFLACFCRFRAQLICR
jgi:hypothetical protein